MTTSRGILYLIPSPIHTGVTSLNYFSETMFSVIRETSCFIVENIRTARRYIKKAVPEKDIDSIRFFVLNKHTKPEEYREFLAPLLNGADAGIISEAGCPGIADPGAEVVKAAHEHNLRVVPLPGPSSIFLALMASGMNGQQFIFHGYLPVKNPARIQKIRKIETDSRKSGQTQIFMETPYRNSALLDDLLNSCKPDTRLCIACNITTEAESIKTLPVAEWKNQVPDIHKKPAVFLIGK